MEGENGGWRKNENCRFRGKQEKITSKNRLKGLKIPLFGLNYKNFGFAPTATSMFAGKKINKNQEWGFSICTIYTPAVKIISVVYYKKMSETTQFL